MYTPEEIAKLEKTRKVSDEKLVDGGAEWVTNGDGEERLELTQSQKAKYKNMMDYNQMRYEKNEPSPILEVGINEVREMDEALDLGSGALLEVRHMIEKGFKHVSAVDELQHEKFAEGIDPEKVSIIQEDIEDYDFPVGKFDLVNAWYTLPFLSREQLPEVIEKIEKSLKKDGIFIASFFGEKDFKVQGEQDPAVGYKKEDLVNLLDQFDILNSQQERFIENAKGNNQHVHELVFIARKK